MTLLIVVSNPTKGASYGAAVEVLQEHCDGVTFAPTGEYRVVEHHDLDPGQAVAVYLTDSRRLQVTEYPLPSIPPNPPLVNEDRDQRDSEPLVINEAAHGHE